MNILFRADSSSQIGTGHIMRDLVLAKQYPNDNIIFATQNLKGNINTKIKDAGYNIKILNSNKINELDELIKKLKIDFLIIDHYGINKKNQKKLKHSNPNLKIMVLDDTYEEHFCDILLNHNISANPKKYKNKVPKDCELRCGNKYTLLREEFYKEKNKLIQKKSHLIKNKFVVLISMGGTDNNNLNLKILNSLKEYKNIFIHITTSNSNKNLKKLQKYTKNKKWVKLHVNTTKIAKLMNESDIAIVTPSVTVNEIIYMEVPFIAIKIAKNQKDIFKYLKKNKYNTLKKFNEKKFKFLFENLLKVRYK